MAVHFHPLKVQRLQKETPDCVSVCFHIPDNLADQFVYKEGQNITLRKVIQGEEIRRSYSICKAPHENELTVAIKKVEGGRFSGFANNELKVGDVLEVLPPTGRFQAKLQDNNAGRYLAIAAGSGITPIMSIIKHTLRTEPQSRFTLLYNNRSRASIIFFEELEGLKNQYIDRFTLIHILSREQMDAPLLHGRIEGNKLADLSKLVPYQEFNAVYLCGPEKMIFHAKDFLEQVGVAKEKIHFELFTTPGQENSAAQKKEKTADQSGPVSQVSIRLDGRTFQFELAQQGQSILDAALRQGADLPFACKGGVCCTCRAKLVEGKVDMDVNYALEQEELDRGFILTCQSHPRTDKVFVDFDQK